MTIALPTRPAPALSVPLLSGGQWTLAEQSPETFTVVVFYRGKHCPTCKTYLTSIDQLIGKAAEQGIDVIAISMDGEDRARATVDEIGATHLNVGYNMPEDTARAWGLYMSSARPGSEEPALFSEPGLFVIRPDGTIFFAQKQSAPFTRPDFDSLLGGLAYVVEHNYPARGDLTDIA